MRNGEFIRGGRERGWGSTAVTHPSDPLKPGECKWVCCGCLPLYVILCLRVLVSLSGKFRDKQMSVIVFVCLLMCVVACQAPHVYHWPFIHLTVHLPTCLSGCLYASLIGRSLNILLVHLQTKLTNSSLFTLTSNETISELPKVDWRVNIPQAVQYLLIMYSYKDSNTKIPIMFTNQTQALSLGQISISTRAYKPLGKDFHP